MKFNKIFQETNLFADLLFERVVSASQHKSKTALGNETTDSTMTRNSVFYTHVITLIVYFLYLQRMTRFTPDHNNNLHTGVEELRESADNQKQLQIALIHAADRIKLQSQGVSSSTCHYAIT